MYKVVWTQNGMSQSRTYSRRDNAIRGIARLRKRNGITVETYWLMRA